MREKEQTDEAEVMEAEVLSQWANGSTIGEIAKSLNLQPMEVVNTVRGRRELSESLRSVRLESLYKRTGTNGEAVAEAYGSLLSKLKKEIEERDLQAVPTEKLIDLYLKALSNLPKQREEITLYTEAEAESNEAERSRYAFL